MNKVEELLLKAKKEDFQKKETKTVKSEFLGKKLGMEGPAEVTIQELSSRRATELSNTAFDKEGNLRKDKLFDANLHLIVAAAVSPDLKNKELMEHFGVGTPKDLGELIFGTDVIKIAGEIKKLSGLTDEEETEQDKEEIKN